jgi:hypothetical protein
MTTRLYTVRIEFELVPDIDAPITINDLPAWRMRPVYEADFAGIHFSRDNVSDLKKWVRTAARNVYGNDTQVLFLHTERQDNDRTEQLPPHRFHEGQSAST